MKLIKNSHVIVLGSGPSVKKCWSRIKYFILKNKDIVTFGCNNIINFITPDYHFWGSKKRWLKFAKDMDKNTILVVASHFPKDVIKKYWNRKYKTFNVVQRKWKPHYEDNCERCKVYYKNKKMFGCFRDISSCAIFYAYIYGARKISVVGNDGYTLYSEKDIKHRTMNLHCYGNGYTEPYTYAYCRFEDWEKYRSLRLLHKYGEKKYGFGFEILTPTIFDKFFNPVPLNIEKDNTIQKWVEPSSQKEKLKLFKSRKIKWRIKS